MKQPNLNVTCWAITDDLIQFLLAEYAELKSRVTWAASRTRWSIIRASRDERGRNPLLANILKSSTDSNASIHGLVIGQQLCSYKRSQGLSLELDLSTIASTPQNPAHWSGRTRNRTPTGAVDLNSQRQDKYAITTLKNARAPGTAIGTPIHLPLPPHIQATYVGLYLSKDSSTTAEHLKCQALGVPMGSQLTIAITTESFEAIKEGFE